MTLHGAAAFEALTEHFKGNECLEPLGDIPFERLRQATSDEQTTDLDLAVLLRHALRFESIRRRSTVSFATNKITREALDQAGLGVEDKGEMCRVTASPWRPDWLPDTDNRAVDETAMSQIRRRFFEGEETPGDPFLAAFDLKSYRSPGQRTAIRAALSMPPGAMLVIDLPTGEGKSMVFRAIDRIGFASDPPGHKGGTTLVIVPTVTLALDHERSCGGNNDNPLSYIGGRTERNAAIREAIDAGTQGLCFTSPEAAVQSLRSTLAKAAGQGKLRAVVIDEAHLVEGWGTGFRTEFQTFAGVCCQWLEESTPETAFRTIMLSATLTKAGEQTLIDLFSTEGEFPVISAARVRPEPEFWVADSTDSISRKARVEEALLHLPRPAILYVTKVEDANTWYRDLKIFGFGRLEVVNGDTSDTERERILERWAIGAIDLVVGNSAFGLGVDFPHARAVLHACIPETFDRFYQEIGRVGRDGCAVISLIIPAEKDLAVAKYINRRTVIGAKRGLKRWRSMFQHTDVISHGHPRYGLRLDVAPGHDEDDIDMTGEKSVDWNARLLALMARGGLIKLTGVPDVGSPDEDKKSPPYQDIEILADGHLNQSTWEIKVEPKRREIARSSQASLNLMQRFLVHDQCPAKLVAELYQGTDRSIALTCPGCHLCRRDPGFRNPDGIVGEQQIPWRTEGKTSNHFSELWGPLGRLLVEYPVNTPDNRTQRDFETVIKRLDLFGLRIFISIGSTPAWICNTVEKVVKERPWITIKSNTWSPPLWPKGASLDAFGDDISIRSQWFTLQENRDAAILLVPNGARDGTNKDRRLADVVPCKTLTLQKFIEELLL